jgi:UDP-glucose 4-epimerase
MVERLLQDYANAYGLNSVALRYFNACGADPEFELGEMHEPETHLIPLVLKTASGRLSSIFIFGQDYPTQDGTCIRDYIHVQDLCSAHQLAMAAMLSGTLTGAECFNLGNGEEFTIQQIINVSKDIVGKEGYTINVQQADRREGDPAVLVANTRKVEEVLRWKPLYSDIEIIIQHAWEWEKRLVGLL